MRLSTALHVGALNLTCLLAVACSGDVDVSPPNPSGTAAAQCADLVASLPDQVAGQKQRSMSSATSLAAAWGDPPVVLRCGVDRPPALRRSSSCFVVNGVGWFAEQAGRPISGIEPVTGPIVFTTIGRSAYVEVLVPPAYDPASDALVDVSAAVANSTTELRPCV